MCMPALAGRIKLEIVGFWKTPEHTCLLFQHQPTQKNKKVKYATNMKMASKHDMLRYGLIHFDSHLRYSINCVWIIFITTSITVTALIVFRCNNAKYFLRLHICSPVLISTCFHESLHQCEHCPQWDWFDFAMTKILWNAITLWCCR